MAYQNDDLMLINRGGTSFKTEYGLLKQNIIDGVGGAIVSETEPTDDLHEGDFWYKPSTETLSIYVVNETTGIVTALTVRNGGSGYNNSGTDISTDGGSGSGLTIDYQAGVGGALVNPTVNQGGHAYQVSDVVFVTGSGNANGSVTVTAVNTVSVGAWEEVSGGDANHNDGPTAPTTGALGDQWYNTDDGRLYTYTEDSSGTLVWIDASPDSIGGGSGGSGDGTTVNYNGASAWGNVAGDGTIDGGLNVASVTKTGTGQYNVVFTTPMPSSIYSAQVTGAGPRPASTAPIGMVDQETASGFRVTMFKPVITGSGTTALDAPFSFTVHSANAIAPQSGVGADAWGYCEADGTTNNTFNIASVTKNGTGTYDVLFTVPMPTGKYSVSATCAGSGDHTIGVRDLTTAGFTVKTKSESNVANDKGFYFAVHASSTVTPTYTWTRDGTTLKPANDGDDVDLGNIQLNADGSTSFAGTNFQVFSSGSFSAYKATSTAIDTLVSVKSDIGGTKNEVFRIGADGSAVIAGNGQPSGPITLKADGSATFADGNIFLQSDGQVLCSSVITSSALAGSGTRPLYADSSGGLTISSSDRSLKTNIATLTDQIQVVKALNPVSFNWIEKKRLGAGLEIGFIAQEVEEIVPEVVRSTAGILSIDYAKLTATLTSALQTALTRIEALEAKVTQLEGGTN